MGLVTPLGVNATATFEALMAGRTIWRCGGEAPEDPAALVRRVGKVRAFPGGVEGDPAVAMAEAAVLEACRDAGVEPSGLPLVVASSKGEVEALVRGEIEAVALGPHGYLAGQLQRRLGTGSLRMVVAACASGLVALDRAYRWLRYPRGRGPETVVVVATDASLAEPFVHSYRRLGVLAPLTPGGYAQRPLSLRRRGFVLAESAAAVVLRVGPTKPGITLSSTSVLCESYDLVRPAPSPAALARCAAVLLRGKSVDMIHPHAPGIEQDVHEMACYLPHLESGAGIYACKGALGHSLGAAGLVAFVAACLCMRSGRRPPMPWLEDPIEAVWPLLAAGPDAVGARHAIFASGFGGHSAGVLIEKNLANHAETRCGRP